MTAQRPNKRIIQGIGGALLVGAALVAVSLELRGFTLFLIIALTLAGLTPFLPAPLARFLGQGDREIVEPRPGDPHYATRQGQREDRFFRTNSSGIGWSGSGGDSGSSSGGDSGSSSSSSD